MNEKKRLVVVDIGCQNYRPVLDYQRKLHKLRLEHKIPDALVFVEHEPVYTIGKSGTDLHVIASADFLKTSNIEVIETDRGGDVTYHGPGQLVGYPIFDLNQHKKSVSWYMHTLEQVFIDALSHWGITGTRNEGYTGVWLDDQKIVALGVRISRWVTMHGFAFNVSPNLEHFSGIIPCGIFHGGVTSLRDNLDKPIKMTEVKEIVIQSFKNNFNFSGVETDAGSFKIERMVTEDIQ
jgi:lipoate-protein ligase B